MPNPARFAARLAHLPHALARAALALLFLALA